MKVFTGIASLVTACAAQNVTARIFSAAAADHIDLNSLSITADAIAAIQELYDLQVDNVSIPAGVVNGNKFDVHAHVVPPWYRIVVPLAGQIPTPTWSLETQLDFMAGAGIRHSVLSIGAPGSVVFPGSKVKSAALARLLNEYLAALAYEFPDIFSFFAVTPLPYTDSAIVEATYALSYLNASGIGLYSNHEGYYLGNSSFNPFFAHLNSSNSTTSPTPVFVHPNGPCLHAANGSLIFANPTRYPEFIVEFYFETARTFMDLTLTQTIVNFTALRWVVPHAGGAFPATIDRFLTSQTAEVQDRSREAFRARMWWDAAGLAFPRQVLGLLVGYDVPTSQLVYGSDFPYAPNYTYEYEIGAINDATFLSEEEKASLYWENGRAIFL